MVQKWFRNQLPAATWLQERLGGLLGSIFEHLGALFEIPKSIGKQYRTSVNLESFLHPPGNLRAGLRYGNGLVWGPEREITEGGT